MSVLKPILSTAMRKVNYVPQFNFVSSQVYKKKSVLRTLIGRVKSSCSVPHVIAKLAALPNV